jgi:MFS family permease
LIVAEGISVAGDWLLFTAASIAVFARTDSTVAVSVLWAFVALPSVVLGPLAGAIADRYSRRAVMASADCVSAVALILCLPLEFAGYRLVAVYVSVFVVNVLATFHRPASEALLPVLAGERNIGRANSGLRMATRIAMIVGPAIASLLSTSGGFRLVLAVDAVSFAASAALLATIRAPKPEGAAESMHSPFRAAIDGLRYARRDPRIRTVIAAVSVTMLMAPIVNAGTLALVHDALKLPESRYGVLLAAEGGGALVLAVLFLYLGPRLRLLPTGTIALVATGASTIALGVSTGMPTAVAAMVAQGMSVVALQVAFASYLQRESVDAYRGRVMSLVSTASSIGALLGLAAAGPVIYFVGVRVAFAMAGAIICVAALPVLFLTLRPAPVPAVVEPAPDVA